MKKSFVVALAAASCVLGASSALAAVVTISENGSVVASWTQSLTPTPAYAATVPPTPNYSTDYYTRVAIANSTGWAVSGPVAWYSMIQHGGVSDFSGALDLTGTQVYSGPESAPIFTTGSWPASDLNNGRAATITISVPEPATWAMMLLGLGMVGFAGRRRQTAGIKYL